MSGHSHLVISVTFPYIPSAIKTKHIQPIGFLIFRLKDSGAWVSPQIKVTPASQSSCHLSFLFFFSSPLRFYRTDFEVGAGKVTVKAQRSDIMKFPALFSVPSSWQLSACILTLSKLRKVTS